MLQFELNWKINSLLVIINKKKVNFKYSIKYYLVLTYIQFIIASYNQSDILGKMFSCLSKWLEFGISIIKIEILFDYLFNSLNNENIFDDASDCIIVLFTSPDALK